LLAALPEAFRRTRKSAQDSLVTIGG